MQSLRPNRIRKTQSLQDLSARKQNNYEIGARFCLTSLLCTLFPNDSHSACSTAFCPYTAFRIRSIIANVELFDHPAHELFEQRSRTVSFSDHDLSATKLQTKPVLALSTPYTITTRTGSTECVLEDMFVSART